MSDKKRKRQSTGREGSPAKRAAITPSNKNAIQITFHDNDSPWKPVLASTPGVTLPKDSTFSVYQNPKRPHHTLLHSDTHSTLDYTTDPSTSSPNDDLSHYIAIYNPSTSTLQLYPSTAMTVRPTLKSARPRPTTTTSPSPSTAPPPSTKRTLAATFGSKKSQKALQNITDNAISPSKPTSKPLSAAAEAVLSTLPPPSSQPTPAQLAAEMDASKPRPRANLSTTVLEDVYPISELVGGEHVLAKLKVKALIDKIRSNEKMSMDSQFVGPLLIAAALEGESGNVRMCRVLRYTSLLIELWKVVHSGPDGPGRRYGKRIPKQDTKTMQPLVESYGGEVVQTVAKRFTEGNAGCGGNVTRWHADLLCTHILALSLHLGNNAGKGGGGAMDGRGLDTYLLQKDLNMEAVGIMKYFKELGCEVKPMNKGNTGARKLAKGEAGMRRIVKLKLPLVFPKVSGGRK